MKRRKEPTKPEPGENGHHMENNPDAPYMNNGYDIKDGKYFLSSGRSDTMTRTFVERKALNDYVETMNRFITERFKEIAKSEKKWWDGILPALQIPPENRVGWYLVFEGDRAVIFQKKSEPKKESPDAA